ncbi:beta-1,4-galactosyltransferase 3-like [Ochotona curzoniae]|uniref:beta-1,4-galactosyltransferase 3-like n=1 Tax=Ochotona curzoniae TaxID=130825 RepID=UPI001B34E3A1|nr:beta-1,4-galactosyltransferase 3-like [Ochotona curzoniae]
MAVVKVVKVVMAVVGGDGGDPGNGGCVRSTEDDDGRRALLPSGKGSTGNPCPMQVNSTAFSRGRLRNVGFWEALRDEDWDCVFLHDVNVLPEDDRNVYTCDFFPAHVSVAIDKFNYKLPYQGYLGGVLSLRPIHYMRIHGFPSGYQSLEDEDNDIATRVELSGMYLSRTHLLFGRYHMLEGQDPGRGQSLPRLRVLAHIRRRWRQDSISSPEYRLLSREQHPLYTNLTVDFSFPDPGATELH